MCFKVHYFLFSEPSTIRKKINQLIKCTLQTIKRALDKLPNEDEETFVLHAKASQGFIKKSDFVS